MRSLYMFRVFLAGFNGIQLMWLHLTFRRKLGMPAERRGETNKQSVGNRSGVFRAKL
jgi:hypothetical protein